MKKRLTDDNFRYLYQYMKRLSELAHKAWNKPKWLTEKDVAELRRLCSLTKCEAATWYQLERNKLESASRLMRENPDYDEMSASQVRSLLRRMRMHKMNYFSKELADFYQEHLMKEEHIVTHINAHRYNGCTQKCIGLAQQVLTMACEMARLSMYDDALIFYLETDLTPNAFSILSQEPARYENLILSLVELDIQKGREIFMVKELAAKLNESKQENALWHNLWWKGTEKAFEKFIAYLVKKGWLCVHESGMVVKPYVVSPGCHEQLARYVVKTSLGKSGHVVPLLAGYVRKSKEKAVSCQQMATALVHEFGPGFTKSQISKLRNEVMGG